MKNKKKVNAKVVQKEVERELSEESLGQVVPAEVLFLQGIMKEIANR